MCAGHCAQLSSSRSQSSPPHPHTPRTVRSIHRPRLCPRIRAPLPHLRDPRAARFTLEFGLSSTVTFGLDESLSDPHDYERLLTIRSSHHSICPPHDHSTSPRKQYEVYPRSSLLRHAFHTRVIRHVRRRRRNDGGERSRFKQRRCVRIAAAWPPPQARRKWQVRGARELPWKGVHEFEEPAPARSPR